MIAELLNIDIEYIQQFPVLYESRRIQRYIPDLYPHIGVKADMCLYI